MIKPEDIRPLSEFQRNARECIEWLEATGRPMALTVDGQAELIVLRVVAYQRLLDLAAHAAAIIGIQRGLQGTLAGTADEAEDSFRSLERELGIPTRDSA